MKSTPTKAAQSGSTPKPVPPQNGGSGSSGNGLKKAWANQTASPSRMTNMDAAKKKVR